MKNSNIRAENIKLTPILDKDDLLENYNVQGILVEVTTEDFQNGGIHEQRRAVQNFSADMTPNFIIKLPLNEFTRKKALGGVVKEIIQAAVVEYKKNKTEQDVVKTDKLRAPINKSELEEMIGFQNLSEDEFDK